MATYRSTSTASSPTAKASGESSLLASILEPVTVEIALVEDYLVTNLIDDNAFVSELLAQIFQAGGKRIRPAITLLSAKATAPDGELGRLHIVLAVLTELIHTASLVHDDVIDRASTRRGVETINRRFNDKLAVLMGDLLFAQASICLARIMNPVIVGIYGQVLGDLCAGELKLMRQQFSTQVDWDGYIKKSINKTASLFAAGSHSGAILNGCADTVVEALKQYGLYLGLCFQLVDDLLDISSSSVELGKQAGSDLQSGVVTAPALFILERGDEVSKRLETLIKSRHVVDAAGNEEALILIREHGGVEKTIELCRKYAGLSQEALTAVPPSKYRNSLEMLVEYVITRTK